MARKGAVPQTAAQRTAARHAPDGPCAGCQARIVRYGPAGRPLCNACTAVLRGRHLSVVAEPRSPVS